MFVSHQIRQPIVSCCFVDYSMTAVISETRAEEGYMVYFSFVAAVVTLVVAVQNNPVDQSVRFFVMSRGG